MWLLVTSAGCLLGFRKSYLRKKIDLKSLGWALMIVIFLGYLALHSLHMHESIAWYGSFSLYFNLFVFAYQWLINYLESRKTQDIILSIFCFIAFLFAFYVRLLKY